MTPNDLEPKVRPSSENSSLENVSVEEAEIALQIPPDAEFVRVVRLTVMGVASRMPFSYDAVEDIKLAVSEACNNAILHARVPLEQAQVALSANAANTNADAGAMQQTLIRPPIVVRLAPFADRLEISVEDGGRIASPGFLVRSARKTVISPDSDEIPEGGMGLFLIQSLMDDVQHHSGENSNTVIHMTKYLPRRDHQTVLQHEATPFAQDISSPVSSPGASSVAVPKQLPTS